VGVRRLEINPNYLHVVSYYAYFIDEKKIRTFFAK